MRALLNRIAGLIRYAVITRKSTDTGSYQVAQLQSLGTTSNAVLLVPYGMAINPPEGTFAIMLASGGSDGNLAAMPINGPDRKHPLAEGEVSIGAFGAGTYLIFRADGKLAIGNQQAELLQLLDDLLQSLLTANVGGVPLDAATITAVTTIKAKLALIKGTI